MDYNEATNYFKNEIDFSNSSKMLEIIAKDKIIDGINFIMELTKCNLNDAKLIWVDLKMEYGTPDLNPYIESNITQKQNTKQYIPKCPMCGSINIQKISELNRATSIIGFGILSKKIGKQWQCNNPKCKHLW